jgi:EpsI family protein
MTARAVALALLVLAASAAVRGSVPPARPLPVSLSAFPRELAGWRGVHAAPLDPDVERVLGADDYLNRAYYHPAAGVVALWVAYYGAQRQGDAIHSPLNCLPGTGWAPIAHTRPLLRVGDRSIRVNRYVVQKRGERQVVTYWFQGRGRAVASEYANKAYLLLDAVRLRRTDGALVRLVAPIHREEARADAAIAAFATALGRDLARWLP